MSGHLSAIVQALRERELLVSAPPVLPEVGGVTLDSRAVSADWLFIAVRGTRVDGHGFIDEAARAGAAAAIAERPVDTGLPLIVVTDSRKAAATAASAWLGHPARDLRLIGVTGTNGKSTSVALLRHVRSAVEPTGAMGTIGAFTADGRAVSSVAAGMLTTPSAIGLHETLARLRDAGARSVAMEVSSHAIDQQRTYGLTFDACLFTTLTPEHLDYHGTMEAYRAVKLRLLEQRTPHAPTAVNRDAEGWSDIPSTEGVIGFGIDQPAEVGAADIETDLSGSRFLLTWRGEARGVQLPLAGRYNVANALGVAACAFGLGQSLDEVVERLSSAPQVPGRMERLATKPCLILRDYAHTPDALARVLATLRECTAGRVVLVYGAGGDRDRGNRAPMGAVAASGADLTFLTTDNPRSEDPRAIARDVEQGMGAADRRWIPDREEAIAAAIVEARSGDTVLLAGKGHETYQIVGSERIPFDEREIVTRLTEAS